MNGRRLQFGIGVIDGLLFVVGGRDGLKTLNTVECFDPKKKQWTTMASMGTHRHGLGQSLTFSIDTENGYILTSLAYKLHGQTRPDLDRKHYY